MSALDDLRAAVAAQPVAPVVGWIGLDVPLEILDAAGLTPVRVAADPAAPGPEADIYGEGAGHPQLRALAARLIELAGRGMDTVFIGGAPVTGLLLYQFLIALERGDGRPMPQPVMVELSHEPNGSAEALNRHSFEALSQRFAGPGHANARREAILARNESRRLRLRLEAMRRQPKSPITGVAALELHAAADALAPAVFNGVLARCLEQLQAAPEVSGRRVVVSGTGANARDFYSALEARGFRVVADDHDFGSRAIGPLADEAGRPLDALIKRYVRRDPAAAQWPIAARADYLTRLARDADAEAVIFDIAAFDHPPAWDYPLQRDALARAQIATALTPAELWRDPEARADAAVQALQVTV